MDIFVAMIFFIFGEFWEDGCQGERMGKGGNGAKMRRILYCLSELNLKSSNNNKKINRK